jgi:formylglycine-generating enzyme required for sulfatase activity
MVRVITLLAFCSSLLFIGPRLYSQEERLQITAEVKETPGEIQFVISGTAQFPDNSTLQVSVLFTRERFDGATVTVTNNKFSVTLGPYKNRYYSGTYTVEALFKVSRQIEPVRKQFADQSEMWLVNKSVRVGTPQKEKEEDRAIADLYGRIITDAEALRQEIWAEYELASKKQRYFKETEEDKDKKKFDEVAWRDFVDKKWRVSLKKDVDAHLEYKESLLALKFPQLATDAELLFGVLFKLSQNISAKLYKENKLREDPTDVTTPADAIGVAFDAPANDEQVNKLRNSIARAVEAILKKTDEDYARKEPEGMVLVPGGTFTMGSTQEQINRVLEEAKKGFSDDFKKFFGPESLRHSLHKAKQVYVKAFYIDKYEVTNREYKKFTDATVHKSPDYWKGNQIPEGMEDCPVVRVTLMDAQEYAKWANKRLPTEAEWEKAARGPKDRRGYPWGGETYSKGKANIWETGEKKGDLKPVGSYPEDKSPCGCYDMCGNAQEWTTDTITITDDPHHSGVHPVIRGGGYTDSPFESRCDFVRWLMRSDEKSYSLGFRCAKDVEE